MSNLINTEIKEFKAQAYHQKEFIEVTKEDAEKEIAEIAKKYNMTESDVEHSLGGINAMIYDLKARKVIDLMKKETKSKKETI